MVRRAVKTVAFSMPFFMELYIVHWKDKPVKYIYIYIYTVVHIQTPKDSVRPGIFADMPTAWSATRLEVGKPSIPAPDFTGHHLPPKSQQRRPVEETCAGP